MLSEDLDELNEPVECGFSLVAVHMGMFVNMQIFADTLQKHSNQ